MALSKLHVGLLGATGAVGKEILALLEESDLPVGEVLAVASARSSVDRLEFRDKALKVANLDLERLRACDVVLAAIPAKVAEQVLPHLLASATPVIDLSGTLGAEQGVPVVVAAVNRGALAAFRQVHAVACPRPLVTALATLLAPVRALTGDLTVRGTAMHAASSRGRAGVEELSRQVVALFNSRPPPRKHFRAGLAFDVEPGLSDPGPDGWTPEEASGGEEAAGLLGLEPDQVAVTSVVAPWFTGLALSLYVSTERRVTRKDLLATWADASGVVLARGDHPDTWPRVQSTREDSLLHVGRVREDPAGDGFHVWAVADEIRFGVAGNALAVLDALLKEGSLLARESAVGEA